MAIPKIRKEFKAILVEKNKATLFLDFDGKKHWIPNSLCTLIKKKKDKIIVTIAAFKFEEITGIEPEDMKKSFVSIGGKILSQHVINAELIESTTTPLYPAQRLQGKEMVKSRYNFVNWEAGAGKTLIGLTLANSYLHANIVDSVVILCPASLQGQWLNKKNEYFPKMKVTIISIEANSFSTSLPKMITKLNEVYGRKHLIIDESHLIKNQSAKRTKNIDRYYKAECVTCLTATAIGKNASDLFYQYSLADRAILGCENYGQFEKSFLLLGGKDGEHIVAYQNTKDLSKRIAPYTWHLTRNKIRNDMPKKHYHTIYYEMENNQQKAYNAINNLISQIQSKSKSGYIPDKKSYQITSFLQKISCGFIPSDDEIQSIFSNLGTLGEAADNVASIKNIQFQHKNKRINEILKYIGTIPNEQAIIWCSYIDEVNALHKILKHSKVFTGGMTRKRISETINDFKNKKFKYLIATQQMGTGFDLPFISYAIYSTTVFDFIKRLQSEDRIYRINRKGDCHIVNVIAKNSIDERIYEVLKYKKQISDIFND